MSAVIKKLAVVGLGMLVVLTGAEMSLRAAPELISDAWYWPTPEAELKYEHLSEEGRDPAVVVLGSSFLEAALDPELDNADLEIYNLAMPFSSLTAMQVWLDEVVLEFTDPRVIVIGIPVWTDEGPHIDISKTLMQAIERSEKQQDREVRLWALRGSLGLLDRSLARERLTGTHLWTESGHQTGYSGLRSDRTEWRRRQAATMGSEEISELRRLLVSAKHQRAEVFILIEPLAESVAPPSVMVDRYVAAVKEIAAEAGVEVWEPAATFWSDANFVDGVHFGAEATAAFSDHVAGRLLEAIGEP